MTSTTVAWPGLAAPELRFEATRASGDSVNAGRLSCSLHAGTHADAPYHVDDAGGRVSVLDPALYMGPCQVLRVGAGAIGSADLEAAGLADGVTRVLLASAAPFDGVHFPTAIPHLDAAAAAWLVERGVRLLGVDVPSVDALDSKTLDVHQVIFAAGGGVLENLRLADVAPGRYELAAAPVLIPDGDAAPVRALLRVL